MAGASPSEEFRHTYPYPASFPLNPPPSPSPSTSTSTSTPPFLFKASLIVESSSGTLLLQDYRKIHRQEQIAGRLAVVLSQSLPNRANTPKLHQSHPPNLQPLPSRSQSPTATVSQAPAQLLDLGWYNQDQTSHGNKATALIQHRPASVAISDPNSHNHPLLRPTAVSRPPPKASLPALPALALNASRLQHQHFLAVEVVPPQFASFALPVLQDQGVSFQTPNPDWALQCSRLRTPGSCRQSFPLLPSIDLDPKAMSSFTNPFKRPRAKSERQPNSPSTTYRSEGPVQTPQTPTTPRRELSSPPVTPLSRTPVVVPELPAEWGPFYQAGHGNPHSPLRNLTARPQLPPGSPHINEEEIGTKFPTLSNGPGIERRVFIDPSYERLQRVATPGSDRPSYHSLTPESNRPSYRSITPEETTGPEQRTPTPRDHRRESAVVRSPRFCFPNPTTGHEQSSMEGSTVGSILQRYGDGTMEEGHGSHDDNRVEIDPRLSNWNWSPPSSLYTPSVHQPQHTLMNATSRRHFPPPTAPPTRPLPDLPISDAEDFLAPGHSQTPLQSTSSAESILERLLTEARPSNANDHNVQESFSASSFAQVSLLASDGSMHSRQLSALETSAFESEVIDRLRNSGVLGGVDHQYIPQGRLSIEYAESGQNDAGDAGPGGFQSSSSMSEARTGIVRSGTPPLLFGSRAIGTGLSEHDLDNQLEDDDQDWETMPDSNGRSRRKFGDMETAAGTGSSIADVSDSSNVSALRSVATAQVLVHPPHPRYQHSWTMLQDAQSGNLVLTPDYAGPGVFPLQNTYEHPTRLSPHHDNPFSTSPPNIIISPRTAYDRGESAPPRNPRRLRSQTGTNFDDGEWVSTVGEEEAVSTRQGSFAKAAIVNRRANITGTPDGTGAREVGSSLANASSPANELESPTFQEELIQRRRTADGSLDSAEANAPGNFYERIKNHRMFRKDSYDEEFELDFMPTPPEDPSPEIRQHRQDLVERSLLPHPPTPPFTKPKRTSVPDCLLKSVNSANMATNGPQAEASSSHAEPSTRDSGPDQPPSNGKQRARSVPPRPAEPEPATTPPRPRTARPYVGPYDDFIQANRGPAQPRAAYMRPGHPDRPIARAGSPHLFRVTGPSPIALGQREKDLSGVIFAALLMCAPFLLLYGYGYLDWVMKWLSRGDIVAFREKEKNIAKPVGYIGIAGVLAVILYGASQIHS